MAVAGIYVLMNLPRLSGLSCTYAYSRRCRARKIKIAVMNPFDNRVFGFESLGPFLSMNL